MKAPLLDPRTKNDIMALVARRAAAYVPEWRCDWDASDPGAALAELFAELFYQTVDRYNALPEKAYIEFLNLLGVRVPPVTPASGFLRFDVHEGIEEPVAVPAGTMVYARDEQGENIVYETVHRIEATPAQLKAVFFSDPRAGIIQRLDMSREQLFFQETDAENLQKHLFCISQNDVLSVSGPCTIDVDIEMSARFLEDAVVKKLADPKFARWSWFDGQTLVPFDETRAEGGVLVLEKKTDGALMPDGAGHICLYCEMASADGRIAIDGVTLRTRPAGDVRADAVANNDIPISQDDGGYCFGRMPAAYGLFYIRSDSVFRKRGAGARVRLELTPIVHTDVDGSPQYTYNKRIIDKSEAVIIEPDDVYVEQVVWEYYNGVGWAELAVEGNRNPFSGKSGGPLELTFRVPEDIETTAVNAAEGWYIRARVVNVANFLSTKPRWILPFVKAVECTWQYGGGRRASWISAENNGHTTEMEVAAACDTMNFEVFSNLEDHPRSMYLCFDRSPHGMPLSMLFEICGKSAPTGKILYEMWNGSIFEPVRSVDNTRNMAHTGAVFLYVTQPVPETELFGEAGFWLRMSLSGFGDMQNRCPSVGGIIFNTVTAVQRQRASDQYFSTETYDAGKRIRLMNTPVMACEVWIDEAGGISTAEAERLEAERPECVRAVRENGALTQFWVRWDQTEVLSQAEPEERVYELDSHTGEIVFGNGRAGRVPPAGSRNIRVSSSYGGGARGNLPAGAVTEFLASVPRIGSLENITPMSGGADVMDSDKLIELGRWRVRNRGRAVGVSDFEELVVERFGRARHVKCFAGMDETGGRAPGHVCIVVMGGDLDGERMARDLCAEIYDYLASHCDCCMAASGRLHVRPSTDVTVNTSVTVRLRDPDLAAQTHQNITDAITKLINTVWRAREIGNQILIGEIYQAIKGVPNVEFIEQVLVEGTWYEDGRQRMRAIEDDGALPYATVTSGTHRIRIK